MLKIYIYSYIDRKILLGFRPAVGNAPEGVYPKDPENIGKAHSQLYVRGFKGSGALGQTEGSVGAVGLGKGAPRHTGRKHFPKVQFLHVGNLSQEETVEIVLIIT